jgi:acyl dehydratase
MGSVELFSIRVLLPSHLRTVKKRLRGSTYACYRTILKSSCVVPEMSVTLKSYQDFIGKEYPPFSVDVEKGRLRLFSKAVGSDSPIYVDEAAAKAAGFRAIPAPPTFAYTVTMDAGQSFNVLEDMGVDLPKAVHGAQRFEYFAPICAGDTITGQQRVKNVYDKKGGALLFIETEIALQNQLGETVCRLDSTIIVRNG